MIPQVKTWGHNAYDPVTGICTFWSEHLPIRHVIVFCPPCQDQHHKLFVWGSYAEDNNYWSPKKNWLFLFDTDRWLEGGHLPQSLQVHYMLQTMVLRLQHFHRTYATWTQLPLPLLYCWSCSSMGRPSCLPHVDHSYSGNTHIHVQSHRFLRFLGAACGGKWSQRAEVWGTSSFLTVRPSNKCTAFPSVGYDDGTCHGEVPIFRSDG